MNQHYSFMKTPRTIGRRLLFSQQKTLSSRSGGSSLFHSRRHRQQQQQQQCFLTCTALANTIPLKASPPHTLCTSSKCLITTLTTTPPRQTTLLLPHFDSQAQRAQQSQQRTFSSNNRRTGGRGGRGGRGGGRGGRGPQQNRKDRGNNAKQGQPMINEHLIRMLLQTSSKTADALQVRLIIDRPRNNNGGGEDDDDSDDENYELEEEDNDHDHDDDDDDGDDQPNIESSNKPNKDQTSKSQQNSREMKSDVQLVSLSQAISISTEIGVDLIGINLQQTIPVIRAIDYSKFLYEQSSKTSKGKKKHNKPTKPNKEFTFRAGIDPHDLQRKTKQMLSYLQKGHSCQVVITSKRRLLMGDKNIIGTTLDRIQEYIGENGNPGKLKTNPQGNRGSILFQPKSKK